MAPTGQEAVPDWQTDPFFHPQSFALPLPTAIQLVQFFQLLQGIIVGVGVGVLEVGGTGVGVGVGVGAQTFVEQLVQYH